MREVTNSAPRGLLKKPNRPPTTRKNRVVFDETRNEFFEADYIILIREDCTYDEGDEEPCACGEHELVRLCCEESCQCNYAPTFDENQRSQSTEFVPSAELVDETALSPPDGYKDNCLKRELGGVFSGHIFGSQHVQQIEVIQHLQKQQAAMLAARNISPHHQQHPQQFQHIATTETNLQELDSMTTLSEDDVRAVCTECAECAECAVKQMQAAECSSSKDSEDLVKLGVPAVALLPLHTSSPERRITEKEIIAGEERPKYVFKAQCEPLFGKK